MTILNNYIAVLIDSDTDHVDSSVLFLEVRMVALSSHAMATMALPPLQSTTIPAATTARRNDQARLSSIRRRK